ncbi:MAG: MarR family transcriptional regulator [Chloroflexi bacterium]|nr:MarR family transcriptional regulator [Chloroflexota bacterium]
MAAITPEAATKARVLRAFQESAPVDLSMSDAARRAGVSLATASTYIKVLVAEGALEESRRIGNAKLFRLR